MAFCLLAIAMLVITLKHVADFHYRIAMIFALAAIVVWLFGFFTHWRYAANPVDRAEPAALVAMS